MFERFTTRARHVFVLADDAARALNHGYIGTEHFLLGLIREEEGIAARVLGSFGMDAENTRADVRRIVGVGDTPITDAQLPFTPRMEVILELSRAEAEVMNHNYVGTEHLLLGLARDGEGVANRIMDTYGASTAAVREEVLAHLSGKRPPEGPH